MFSIANITNRDLSLKVKIANRIANTCSPKILKLQWEYTFQSP